MREAGGAEAEGHGVDVRDVDAGELGAELLLGDRADRLAGVGEVHQQPEQPAPPTSTTTEADHARHCEERDAEIDVRRRRRRALMVRVSARNA